MLRLAGGLKRPPWAMLRRVCFLHMCLGPPCDPEAMAWLAELACLLQSKYEELDAQCDRASQIFPTKKDCLCEQQRSDVHAGARCEFGMVKTILA